MAPVAKEVAPMRETRRPSEAALIRLRARCRREARSLPPGAVLARAKSWTAYYVAGHALRSSRRRSA